MATSEATKGLIDGLDADRVAIVQAAWHALNDHDTTLSLTEVNEAAHAALMALADAFSRQAHATTAARTKGHVGVARDLQAMAVRVRGMASGLKLQPFIDRLAELFHREYLTVTPNVGLDASADFSGVPGEDSPAPAGVGVGDVSLADDGSMTVRMVQSAPTPAFLEPATFDQVGAEHAAAMVPPVGFGVDIAADGSTMAVAAATRAPDGTLQLHSISIVTDPLPGTEFAVTPVPARTVPSIEGDGATVAGLQILRPGQAPTPPAKSLTPVGGYDIVAPKARPVRLSWSEFASGVAGVRQRDHVSWTTIESLAQCGVAWALSHAHAPDGSYAYPSVPTFALVGGKAVHSVVEAIHAAAASAPDMVGLPLPSEQAWQVALQGAIDAEQTATGVDQADWIVAKNGLENAPWWMVNGHEMIKRYVTYWSAQMRDGWTVARLPVDDPDNAGLYRMAPAVELSGRITLKDPVSTHDIEVWLTLDSLWYHAQQRRYRLVDLKTGDRRPATMTQLGLYGHWVAEQLTPGKRFAGKIEAGFFMARQGSHDGQVDDALSIIDREGLGLLASSAASQIGAGAFLPHVTTFGLGCGQCGHRDRCPARASM